MPKRGNPAVPASWVHEYTEDYRLTQRQLKSFLESIFVGHNIVISLAGDQYHFWIPRKLRDYERDTIDHIRGQLLDDDVRERSEERVPQNRGQKTSYSTKTSNKANNGQSSSINTNETTEYESMVPLIQVTQHGRFEIPSQNGGDGKVIYSVSDVASDQMGTLAAIYSVMISRGKSSQVYAVDARWSWTKAASPSSQDESRIAIKRLAPSTSPEQFIDEYKKLRNVTNGRHPNVIDLVNAFRYEDERGLVRYNFSFPLALGNLKQLFHPLTKKSIQQQAHILELTELTDPFEGGTRTKIRQSLWSEMEGLSNALAYLHEECQIAHSDIKPSNIVLYETKATPPLFTAKLTDFGMAVHLKTKLTWRLGTEEARSAFYYDPPEIRNNVEYQQSFPDQDYSEPRTRNPSPEDLKSGDVWKLGAVFVEMLTYLVMGDKAVARFRDFITTRDEGYKSDSLMDTRLDNGERVKPEVLEWLSKIAKRSARASEVTPLLELMLSQSNDRPTSAEVSRQLRNSNVCLYFDGERYLNFVQPSSIPQPSLADSYKAWVENFVGQSIDWWPLERGNRQCEGGKMRISWYSLDEWLYVDVTESSALRYRKACQPVSEILDLEQGQSTGNASYPMNDNIQSSSSRGQRPSGRTGRSGAPAPHGQPSQTETQDKLLSSVRTGLDRSKVIYLCIDRAWSDPKETELCSGYIRQYICDDRSFCKYLISEYNRVRGWKGRYLSWKSCREIDFIAFHKTSVSDQEVIKLKIGLPPSDLGEYEYRMKGSSEETHMKIAGTEIIKRMHKLNANLEGTDTTMQMVPQRILVPLPDNTISEQHWGIHARSRFIVFKILAWVSGLTIAGLVFVIMWLVFISKTDLQNAFIPVTFLSTMIMIGLGIPQFLGID